jgi:hypothetical protein
MTITTLDCFYIIMFVIVFGFIIHIETNIKILLEMMKEHVKCDSIQDLTKEE